MIESCQVSKVASPLTEALRSSLARSCLAPVLRGRARIMAASDETLSDLLPPRFIHPSVP
jgi:hypothetical protein